MKPLYYIVLLLLPQLLAAQQYYIKGRIKDEEGRPLANASIVLHSTGYMYRSGSEGAFGIVSTQAVDTLSVSLSGYNARKAAAPASGFTEVTLERAPRSQSATAHKLASLTQNLRRDAQQQWFTGDETYASIIENQFIPAATYPTTGLSLSVDRASYSNVRRFLNMNSPVPPDAVRIEEMLNYFNFGYREPDSGQCFAIRAQLTDCPWNKDNKLLLAQVLSRRLPDDSLPPSHLVFLIDVSGSMDMPNRLPLLKGGFRALVNNLRPQDSVSIVAYGGTVGVMLNTTSGQEKEKIFKAIDSLQPGGSTPGESGIKLAYSVARNHFIKGGNNRIILATDGDFNVGLRTDEELEELVVNNRIGGIYLTCLGIGMGNYKDSKIQMLAQRGNGNFAYIDSYAEAEKVLLREFSQTLYTVADDAFLQATFDPDFIKDYRLIGFGNKVGAIKDTAAEVEGGEIGPAFSLMVAFELTPTDRLRGMGLSDSVFHPAAFRLQYQPTGKKHKEYQEVRPAVSYRSLEAADSATRLAAAVIMFGGVLRESRFFKEVGWSEIARLAATAARPGALLEQEFLQLVQQARHVYKKKKKWKGL